jgi:hypothetical protein
MEGEMNINDLTIGQAKELATMFATVRGDGTFTPHIGKRCIVRTYASGVFFATIVKQDGRMVEMQDARRLWSWKAADGISLSAVAIAGVDPTECKFPHPTPAHTVLDALEIIPVSDDAARSINTTPIARAM